MREYGLNGCALCIVCSSSNTKYKAIRDVCTCSVETANTAVEGGGNGGGGGFTYVRIYIMRNIAYCERDIDAPIEFLW